MAGRRKAIRRCLLALPASWLLAAAGSAPVSAQTLVGDDEAFAGYGFFRRISS